MSNFREKLIPARDLVPCTICSRNFNVDRIKIHQAICQKSNANVRKAFDITQQRVRGTEAEKFIKPTPDNDPSPNVKKSSGLALNTNWRRRHEEFITNVKDAKTKLKEKNKKVTDLPYPPQVDLNTYPQCPYCTRQVNEDSFEKHTEVCAWYNCKKTPSKRNTTITTKSKISIVEQLE